LQNQLDFHLTSAKKAQFPGRDIEFFILFIFASSVLGTRNVNNINKYITRVPSLVPHIIKPKFNKKEFNFRRTKWHGNV
jgi:hypothetical protein